MQRWRRAILHLRNCYNVQHIPGHLPRALTSVWARFRELTQFFRLNLGQVVERWSDGKGPLASQLSGGELARLVVSVYEKTARRDAFISQLAAAAEAR